MLRLKAQTADDIGTPRLTSTVQSTGGVEYWLCSDYGEIRDAIGEGRPFEAMAVIGMKATPVVINPAHVITLKDESAFA